MCTSGGKILWRFRFHLTRAVRKKAVGLLLPTYKQAWCLPVEYTLSCCRHFNTACRVWQVAPPVKPTMQLNRAANAWLAVSAQPQSAKKKSASTEHLLIYFHCPVSEGGWQTLLQTWKVPIIKVDLNPQWRALLFWALCIINNCHFY